MSMARYFVVGGAFAVLALVGGVWSWYRETNSVCSDPFYMDLVHGEMREEMIEQSRYLKALEDGVESDQVSAANKARYADAAAALREAIETTRIRGRMKHPNSAARVNCQLSLPFSATDVLAEFDLDLDSFLGVPVDRRFDMVARFEVRFEEIDGVTLQSNIERERNQFLIDDIAAGETVESARIAKLTRREFTLQEPSFPDINYNTSFVADEAIEARWLGK